MLKRILIRFLRRSFAVILAPCSFCFFRAAGETSGLDLLFVGSKELGNFAMLVYDEEVGDLIIGVGDAYRSKVTVSFRFMMKRKCVCFVWNVDGGKW